MLWIQITGTTRRRNRCRTGEELLFHPRNGSRVVIERVRRRDVRVGLVLENRELDTAHLR